MVKTIKDKSGDIEKLQMLEQKSQTLLYQKQNFQAQLLEIENALNEVEVSGGELFKIVGNVMISAEKGKLREDLNNKREIVSLRIKNLEKQESTIREEAAQLQKEVMKNLKKESE